MIIRQFFDSVSSTYSYLIADHGEALFIDPVIEKTEQYIELIKQLDVKLTFAVDTHTHADHITALGKLRDALGCKSMLGEHTKVACVSQTFKDGEVIPVGSLNIKSIYTPGHTDDSYSFYLNTGDERRLFTGDTLLIRGTGRTDFQNGDANAQYDSLFNKLLVLPEDTLVYPGHDYKGMTVSTIGEEKRFNPRLQVSSAAQYAEIMANLNLPDPKLMDIAVPANLKCGKSA